MLFHIDNTPKNINVISLAPSLWRRAYIVRSAYMLGDIAMSASKSPLPQISHKFWKVNFKGGQSYKEYNAAQDVNGLSYNVRLKFFATFLSNGWHVITSNLSSVNSSHRNLISQSLVSYRKMSHYSIQTLWSRWNNLMFLVYNIYYYQIKFFVFGRIYTKYVCDSLNWKSWQKSPILWKYSSMLFYFKYNRRTDATLDCFKLLYNAGNLSLVTDLEYHFHTVKHLEQISVLTIGIGNENVEPWLCWYPIFCRGGDSVVQLFILTTFLKIQSLAHASLRHSLCKVIYQL